jgi:hypothetical protein
MSVLIASWFVFSFSFLEEENRLEVAPAYRDKSKPIFSAIFFFLFLLGTHPILYTSKFSPSQF